MTYTTAETTLGVVLFHRVVVTRLLPDVLAALETLQDLTLLLLDWLAWDASTLRGKEYGASPLVVLLGDQAIAVRANHV